MKLKNLERVTSKIILKKINTYKNKGIQQLIMLRHKRSKRQPSIITVKGKDITNPKNIVNALNNFSTNIGPSLSKTIPQSKKNFKNFLNNSSLNLFVLKPVTHDEV